MYLKIKQVKLSHSKCKVWEMQNDEVVSNMYCTLQGNWICTYMLICDYYICY